MKKITTKEFDQEFDDGKDISKHLKKSSLKKVNQKIKRVNIDFPSWVIDNLDQEANRLGITRQALVKFWIVEKIDKLEKA